MSTLFLISTPIGNRKDITLRAIETMFSVDILLCEDTRKTKQLMDFYREQFKSWQNSEWFSCDFSQQPQLLSFFEENEDQRIPYIIESLHSEKTVGLVSNAGTPGISDPGFSIVNACVAQGIPVVSIPGPSAVISALSISGFSADKFTFLGFLPKKPGKQTTLWESIRSSGLKQTVIFYESPYRVKKTLETLMSVYGDIPVCIARELTKIHQELTLHSVTEWLKKLETPLKGELVILFRA